MMDDDDSTTLEAALQTAVTEHGRPLSSRWEASVELIGAITSYLQGMDHQIAGERDLPTARKALTSMLQRGTAGPEHNGLLREALLNVLPQLKRQNTRQVVLDFLPVCVQEEEEETDEKVLQTLRTVMQQDETSHLPVLRCLSALPLDCTGHQEAFELSLKIMVNASEKDLFTVVQIMLRHVRTKAEAAKAWNALRDKLQSTNENDPQQNEPGGEAAERLPASVLKSFRDVENGELLIKSYLQTLSETEVVRCLYLDMAVLLVLSQHPDHTEAVDQIFDAWLTRGTFPFETMERLVKVGQQSREQSVLDQHVVPSLLRLAIFLLLAPARISVSVHVRESIQSLVLQLHQGFDTERQEELVQSLFLLCEEISAVSSLKNADAPRGRKRKRNEAEDVEARRWIHGSVNAILLRLAETFPGDLVRCKASLIRHLALSVPNGQQQTRELCCIVARLVSDRSDGFHSSEVMMLLQKLLFSSTAGPTKGDSSTLVRGLWLATELIRSSSLNPRDKECIREWVLRLLLPATRRMVDPELGSPGLSFLKAWMQSDESQAKNFFQHFKMILANTGLIQMLKNYEKTRKDNVIIGYTRSPSEFIASESPLKTRDMLFCVNFFLRHNDMTCPSRWRHAIQWVFELVDTYLRLGRQKTPNWRPHGWLTAAIEFPAIALPKDIPKRKQQMFTEWMNANFNDFSLSHDMLEAGGLPSEIADAIISTLSVKRLGQFQDSVFHLTLALLTGCILSAAVLKNTFDHLKTLSDTGSQPSSAYNEVMDLIKLQLMKMYDLRSKSIAADAFLGCLHSALRRLISKKNAATTAEWDEESDDSQSDPELSAEVPLAEHKRLQVNFEHALHQSEIIRSAVFNTQDFIVVKVLWECLADRKTDQMIRRFLGLLVEGSLEEAEGAGSLALRLMDLQSNLVRHLASVSSSPDQVSTYPEAVKQTQFVCLVQQTCFLLDILPKLRAGYFVKQKEHGKFPGFSMSFVVHLCVFFLQLLSVVLTSSTDSLDVFVHWFNSCSVLLGTAGAEGERLDPRRRTFHAFSEYLRVSENAIVANHILEILSILAMNSEVDLKRELTEISWISLHTVYVPTDDIAASDDSLPYALALTAQRFSLKARARPRLVLKHVLDSTVGKVNNRGRASGKGFDHPRHGLLRHWGLLTDSTMSVDMLVCHLSSLASELGLFLESLGTAVGDVSDSEEKKSDDGKNPKAPRSPLLPGLEAATFPDYFEVVLNMVVGATATVEPGIKSANCVAECGPYLHLDELFCLFRCLIDLYAKRFLIFPRKSASIVLRGSREMLSAAVAQLQQAVDWRNAQPLLSAADKEAGQQDPGAIEFLQKLIDVVASHTVGSILSLCDFWQTDKQGSVHLSKSTSLRFSAEKAATSIKDISASHNLVHPSFDIPCGHHLCEEVSTKTKGFHQMESSLTKVQRKIPRDHSLVGMATPKQTSRLRMEEKKEERVGSDSDSFGVDGDWGDDSDGNSETGGLNLQSSLILRT